MGELTTMMAVSSFGIAGLCLTSAAGLKAWSGWLDLKRIELSGKLPSPAPASRMDMADIKERVRKLEAIANGVEF